jgi:hypothetical protein
VTPKRAQPLAADPVDPGAHTALPEPDPLAERVRTLRIGTARIQLGERILLVLGGIIAPLGLVVVILGWWGAARTPFLFEQVPYLISGGLLGLGLVFLGAFFYFAHWLTELVKEHRVQSRAMLDAIGRLHDQVAQISGSSTATAANGHHPDQVVLVATDRGSMAHRVECVVVAGKVSLRPVGPADGLAACKLCYPYGAPAASA